MNRAVANGASAGDHSRVELFDAPSLWRALAALELGLDGDELIAAVSPGPAYPSALETIAAALPDALHRGPDVIVDVGAGPGGASEWFRQATNARVIAVESAELARTAARTLFPALMVVPGDARATGLPSRLADVVLASGLVSLVDVIDPVLDELIRLLRPGGVVAIADLFSADRHDLCSGPNVFRSFEAVSAHLAERGCRLVEVGCGLAAPTPTWAAPAERVDAWIRERCRDHPAFPLWQADREHLSALMSGGSLLGGCLVARLDD